MTAKKNERAATPLAAFDRRSFLKYVGTGATAVVGSSLGIFSTSCAVPPSAQDLGTQSKKIGDWVRDGVPRWKPPPYPVPLPGDDGPAAQDKVRLAEYEVTDDLVLPEGFRYDVVARWGDVFGPPDDPAKQIRFGYNNDYTGLLPISQSDGEYWLFVNHEYVSPRPWLEAWREVYGDAPPKIRLIASEHNRKGELLIGSWSASDHRADLDSGLIPKAESLTIAVVGRRILDEMGVSVLRVRRVAGGRFEVIKEAGDHKRITAHEAHNVDPEVVESFRFTGPAAALIGDRPRGTMCNCSGGTSPWGTFLTCEENLQNQVHEDVRADGRLLAQGKRIFSASPSKLREYQFDHPVPESLNGSGLVLGEPLDGRHYGWVSEVDPETGRLVKHTSLGRFRHENVALFCRPGQRLAAYMGDDRRGGHVWKFVSEGIVEDPSDQANSRLLEHGTLHVARFYDDFTGEWIPLEPGTPLRRPEPEHLAAGRLQLPARPQDGPAGGTVYVVEAREEDGDLTPEEWCAQVEAWTGKPFAECTLGDLVRPEVQDGVEPAAAVRGVLLLDAFAMADACGGTPTARPEDLEVHPDAHSVYIAFTSADDGSTGSPDRRIFPDSARDNSRQYGAVFTLFEGTGSTGAREILDPKATAFRWGKLVPSGEVAEQGGGFACADNLAFDPAKNLWMVTDITTTAQNFPARGEDERSLPGKAGFPGLFGNNSMFMIPTSGPRAGQPYLFAQAPMEAELCGPTFSEDGEALLLSVQHPGEKSGTRSEVEASSTEEFGIYDREEQIFSQRRVIPRGSNFPEGSADEVPRPAVVCITRQAPERDA